MPTWQDGIRYFSCLIFRVCLTTVSNRMIIIVKWSSCVCIAGYLYNVSTCEKKVSQPMPTDLILVEVYCRSCSLLRCRCRVSQALFSQGQTSVPDSSTRKQSLIKFNPTLKEEQKGTQVLGVVHYCQHYQKRTEYSFCDPLPPKSIL